MIPHRWIACARYLSAQITTAAYPPPVRLLISIVAHSGDSLVWLLIGSILWARQAAGARTLGTRIWLTVLVTSVLSFALKQLFRRQRPSVSARGFYHAVDRYSFPSGHAVRIGALTIVLSAVLPIGAVAALILWSLLVCASRIALQVHFVRDVGVGLLLGWGAGLLLIFAGV